MTAPSWITELANAVAERLLAAETLAPLGCHHHHDRTLDQWEVTIFAAGTEIVGGEADGRMTFSAFHVDLRELSELFDHIDAFVWQAADLGEEDELGPHVSVEGLYHGHPVWLRILARPPVRFAKGRTLNAYDSRIEDVW